MDFSCQFLTGHPAGQLCTWRILDATVEKQNGALWPST